jgi:hypothetical protein
VCTALDLLALCDRFHCLPSALMNESAELFRMLDIEGRVKPDGEHG